MTTAGAAAPRHATTRAALHRPGRRAPWRSWAAHALPSAVTLLLVTSVLARYGTPVGTTLAFVLYAALVLAVPGAVVWRVLLGRHSLLEDAAAGAVLGIAVQVLAAYALSPLGLAVWSAAVLPATALAVTLVPRLRRRLGGGWRLRASLPTSWTVAAAVCAAVVWVAATGFGSSQIAGVPGPAGPAAMPVAPQIDMAFQHAVTAGIDRHWPLVYPFLYDEPLKYHLFVYEAMANARAVTGAELAWVVYRLEPALLLVLAVLLCAAVVRRLAGTTAAAGWGATVGALASQLVPTFRASPPMTEMRWGDFSPGLLNFSVTRSPTQSLGTVLVLGLVLVVVTGRPASRSGAWARYGLFAVLALAAGGAKVTALPVVGAGLALAFLAALVGRRRPGQWLALGSVVVAAVALTLRVIYGADGGSLRVEPLHLLRVMPAVRLLGGDLTGASTWAVLALTVGGGLAVVAGTVGLGVRVLRDDRWWFLAGMVVAGVLASLVLAQNGYSEIYFFYAAWPAAAVLGAWGLASVRAGRWWAAPALVLAGVAATWAVRRWVAGPVGPGPVDWVADVLRPGAVLALLGTLTCLAAALGARRWPDARPRAVAVAVAACLVVGGAMSTRALEVAHGVAGLRHAPVYWSESGTQISDDARAAALVVRERSGPDDVVATNAHCTRPDGPCYSLHFWISALTERRVVVESWGYPEKSSASTATSPYEDPARLAVNDRVFTDADPRALDELVARYDVRWLYVDRTLGQEHPALRELADLVVDTPTAAVYRMRP